MGPFSRVNNSITHKIAIKPFPPCFFPLFYAGAERGRLILKSLAFSAAPILSSDDFMKVQ